MPLHHRVYVVLLDVNAPEVWRRIKREKSKLGAVYVGSTGIDVEERYAQHKRGYRHNSLVQRHGLLIAWHLMPDIVFTFEDAQKREHELAGQLVARGYTVVTG